MIRKLLVLLAFVSSGALTAQATAYPMPNITSCAFMPVDLTQQTEIVLGNQNPTDYSVGYYHTETDAVTDTNLISQPQFYLPIPGFDVVYARVTNLSTQEYAVGSFFIFESYPPDPLPDVVACDSYTLPACNCTYSVNGVNVFPGSEITQTSVVTIETFDGMCPWVDDFNVTIGNPVVNPLNPLSGCDNDGDGFGMFYLDDVVQQITQGAEGEIVTFHETQADAQANSNPLISPYTNILANSQTVFVRVSTGPDCVTIVPLQLQTVACATISGVIRLDADGNGCSASDPADANQQVTMVAGNHYFFAFSDALGNYTFTNVPAGYNTVYITLNQFFGTVQPVSQTVYATADSNYTMDFCITPSAPLHDVAVYYYPTINARPGFAASYKLLVQNTGNQPASGTVSVTYDDARLNFVAANPAQSAQASGALTFTFSNLPPTGVQAFTLDFMVENPPVAQLGDILNFTADAGTGDDNPANDHSAYAQTVVNSLDPNDKLVSQTSISPGSTDYLQYVVNFQNTGTATADNVKITDQLDAHLDWTTFRPISASHPFSTEMSDTGAVTFTFPDIALPAQSADEPASHGYVIYEARPLAGGQLGDAIENTANIYFDFNAPIVTNTVVTNLVELGLADNQISFFTMSPNPTSGHVTLRSLAAADMSAEIADMQGKTLLEASGAGVCTMDVSGLASGMYIVKVESGGKSSVRKLIKR